MNGFFPRRYNPDEAQSYGEEEANAQHQHMMDMSGGDSMGDGMGDGMGGTSIPGAQSLDDIVSQNQKDLRRRSMPLPFGGSPGDMDDSMRRASIADMMEFGGTSPQMGNFQFGPSVGQAFDSHMMDAHSNSNNRQRQRTAGSNPNNLSVNTQFSPHASGYGQMNQSASVFESPLAGHNTLDMDMNSPYLTSAFPSAAGMGTDMNMMSTDMPAGDMFSGQFGSPMAGSPIHQTYTTSMLAPNMQDPGGGSAQGRDHRGPANSNTTPDVRQSATRTNSNDTIPTSSQGGATPASKLGQASGTADFGSRKASNASGTPDTGNDGWPSALNGRPHIETRYKDAYAPSGYDVMSLLIKMATRPNPQINIGSVDLSCAFVVCNAKEHDNPIEYCSESFERLTGYTKYEIKGQNCRFLQSPDGKVSAGTKRKYCDDDSVLYVKNCINTQSEAQISLINYRKGGQPFMNLLTMIPIQDQTGETTHFVGFQVDLVENPTAINSKNPDGTYSINYQRHESLPGYYLPAHGSLGMAAEAGQTVNRDEVSTVLGTIGAGENELSRRLMDKVLLENADDVIHVLSLKGLFLYLSPSCRKVLEYDAGELVGTPLSSVCHPSDIVPVTRELKDPSSGSNLSVVFRIRRKNSGYMWFESHGSLHTEQGKGRKCIILVGRERPVYTLSKTALMAGGGVGENELWTKMSTTGMFLFVSSNVRQLLDRQPEELVGTNIQTQMRPESKDEFGRVLTLALAGKNTSVRHEMTNRRGQVLQAFSWIYPGDATEGAKPTFLVAQIRLIRYHRGGGQRPPLTKGDSAGSLPSANSNPTMGSGTPFSNQPGGGSNAMETALYATAQEFPISHAGQNALAIGRQDLSLASEDNVFDELKTTRSTSWQYELRQMEKRNRILAEEVQSLIAAKKKRKRRRGAGLLQKDCANCHTKNTPEWRRGPSGQRDLCNSCGLRWAKQNGRVSPRTSSQQSVKSGGGQSDKASKASASPGGDDRIGGEQQSIAHVTETTGEKRNTAQEASMERHHAKVARMEVAGSMRLSGGVPAKIIEEGSGQL